jgi:integration host factor subunit alpha
MIPLTKEDLTSVMSEMGYCKDQANEFITELFRTIGETLVRGESVRIRGFGLFEVKTHKGHLAHNAITGENRMLEAYPVVSFRPGDNLKSAVRSGDAEKLKVPSKAAIQ